jgi:hypothetical protein
VPKPGLRKPAKTPFSASDDPIARQNCAMSSRILTGQSGGGNNKLTLSVKKEMPLIRD